MWFPVVMALSVVNAAFMFVATGSGWWFAAALMFLNWTGTALIEIDNERECWDE